MNFVVGILASIAVVQAAPYNGYYRYPAATTLVRAPEHDSAIVHSDRSGGNFAYSIAQRHAYQVLVPHPVASYNHDPFGYTYHKFNQLPFGARVPGHHFYIQHPFTTTIVPSYVPVVYPEHPTEEYPVEQNETVEDSEPTENPDSEIVVAGENVDDDTNVTREETTDENDVENDGGSDDTTDDSITVDAYRFGGDN